MRKLILLLPLLIFYSCATVDSGHQGVEVSWGGKTNMDMVYHEGMHGGLHWLWDHMMEYDSRQKTVTLANTLLDKDGLSIPIEVVVYYNILPNTANKIHKEIGPDYENTKIIPIMKAAMKNVIPKYKALDLNVSKREQADSLLFVILRQELSEVYCELQRVNITDVDIPKEISSMIVAKQKQDEANLLAEKKKLEEENLAAARIAKAKGDYEAAQYEAKTKAILSQPMMLKLKELEIQQTWAEKGVSPYGQNNVFGANTSIVRGLN
jgi:regulator of protease activity HflC (stomatin/prohibitin superfamily)